MEGGMWQGGRGGRGDVAGRELPPGAAPPVLRVSDRLETTDKNGPINFVWLTNKHLWLRARKYFDDDDDVSRPQISCKRFLKGELL